MAKRGLGRGLDALFQNYETDIGITQVQNRNEVTEIRISEIDPNKKQPRREFDEEKILEMAESIRTHGIVQPIIVKPNKGRYQIIAGERRWRAARAAGLTKIPSIIREYDDKEVMEIALVENLQREDLNPIEEATAIKTLMDEHKLTQEQVAERIGRSRPAIANTIRLLMLPDKIQNYITKGQLSPGHARALLGIEGEKLKIEAAEIIIEKGLNVRQTEELIKKLKQNQIGKKKPDNEKPTYLTEIEASLEESLGTKVVINPGKKKGIIEIEYYNNEDLERIIQKIKE